MDDIYATYEAAFKAVRTAGDAVMEIYRSDYAMTDKEDGSPVTKADMRAHNVLLEGLASFEAPIVSEEDAVDGNTKERAGTTDRLAAERVWIIDPLDGTSDFIDATGEFSIMVGLAEHGTPIFGLVYLPVLDKLYCAARGKGAYLIEGNEVREIAVSDTSEMTEARAVVSRNHIKPEVYTMLEKLGVPETVGVGSNGIKIGRIAEGTADLFFNPTNKMGEWDSCGPHVILEEAGGMISGTDGSELSYNNEVPVLTAGIAATNGALHDELIATLTSSE